MASFFRGLMILLLLLNPFLGLAAILIAYGAMSISRVASAISSGIARKHELQRLKSIRKKKISGVTKEDDEEEPHAA